VAQVISESIYDDIKTLEKTVKLYEQGFIEPLGVRTVSPAAQSDRQPDPVSLSEVPSEPEETPRLPYFDLGSETPPTPTAGPYSEPTAPEAEPSTQYDIREPSILEEFDEEQPTEEAEVVNVNQEEEIAADISQPPDPTTYAEMGQETEERQPSTDKPTEQPSEQANPFASFCDTLFNGETSGAGHIAIIASDEQHRKQLISTLTAGQYSAKPVDTDGSQSTERGRIVTPSQNVVDIVGLSSDRTMLNTLTQFSSKMLGYVVLIGGDRLGNLGYWGYLLNSLKKKFPVPRTIAIYYSDENKKISLDAIQKSLRCAEDEQLVQLQIENPDSVQLLLQELRGAK
jgi:hypothetical protein